MAMAPGLLPDPKLPRRGGRGLYQYHPYRSVSRRGEAGVGAEYRAVDRQGGARFGHWTVWKSGAKILFAPSSSVPHGRKRRIRLGRPEKSLAAAHSRLSELRQTDSAIETAKRANVASWSAWALDVRGGRAARAPALSATVRVERTEEITVLTGSSPHGQGHETVFAQVTAEKMRVSMDHVVIRHGDTLVVQQGVGTFGSRSAITGGGSWLLLLIASSKGSRASSAAHLIGGGSRGYRSGGWRLRGGWSA